MLTKLCKQLTARVTHRSENTRCNSLVNEHQILYDVANSKLYKPWYEYQNAKKSFNDAITDAIIRRPIMERITKICMDPKVW